MRKVIISICAVMIIISLCSCVSSVETTYTVTRNGTEFIVDTENSTIFDGTNTYTYAMTGNATEYNVEIIYPDGSKYWWKTQRNSNGCTGFGGWSDDYDEDRYMDGNTLYEVLNSSAPQKTNFSNNILLSLVLIVAGTFGILKPEAVWYLEHGWRYKNAGPSDLALVMNRIGGVILVIAAIVSFWI